MSDRHPEPGPGPEDAPGLDAGNSVKPGDTPPDAGSSDKAHGAPPAKSASSGKLLIVIGVIGVALLVLVFVGYIVGIID